MNLKLFKTIKSITLTGLRNHPVTVYPAMILSVKQENEASLISLLDGESVRVKESPGTISSMITNDYRTLTRKAYAYSHLVEADENYEDPFGDEDDDRYYRVQALKNMAFSKKHSTIPRLLSIYRQILSPFTFFRGFSGGPDETSNYRKDMEEIIEELKSKRNEPNKKS